MKPFWIRFVTDMYYFALNINNSINNDWIHLKTQADFHE